MNKVIPVLVAILVFGSAITAGILYFGGIGPITRDVEKDEDDTNVNVDDPDNGGGSLSSEVKEKWKSYSGGEVSPEVITIDPGIAKTSPGEELEKLARLEGLNNFTDSSEGSTGGNDTNEREKLGSAEESSDMDDDAGGGEDVREVEEADLVKVIGNTLFVLNSYRGLLTIDISDPENAHISGQCSVIGYPVEMYVVDFLAIITVRTNYNFWYRYWDFKELSDDEDNAEGTIGTMIYIVNVEDPRNPRILKIVELEGFPAESRRVGHVIYQATNTYGWYWYYDDGEPETIVTSIDFGDPRTVGMKDQIRFEGNSNQVHASSTAFYVAQPEWVYDERWDDKDDWDDDWDDDDDLDDEREEDENITDGVEVGEKTRGDDDKSLWPYPFEDRYRYYTNFTYLDIADPDGDIITKDTFRIPGQLNDKYQMDEYKDTFRVVTHYRHGIGESRLYIVDISTPADIEPLGTLLIDDAGSLMATRFAGERGYTIHLPRAIDPLDVLDLSDPTDPKLCDVFEMPGWVTHMEVRGMKIIALGVDDSECERNIAVSLFDVEDPYKVKMLKRVRLGGENAYSSANWEPKALTIDDSHDIIVVPFNSYTKDWESIAGVQIVKFDLEEGTLSLAGSVSGKYSIERTRVVDDWILATSFKNLQVIDIGNLEKPEVAKLLDLCINIKDVIPVGDKYIQMTQDWYDGSVVLRCVEDIDDLEAIDTLTLESNWADIFEISSKWILAANVFDDEKFFGKLYNLKLEAGQIELVEVAQLPEGMTFKDNDHYYGWYGYYDYGGDDMVLEGRRGGSRYIYYPDYDSERFVVAGTSLVYYHVGEHPYIDWKYDEEYERYMPTPEEKGMDKMVVFDLSDLSEVPTPATLDVETYSFMGMKSRGDRIYVQHRMSGVNILNRTEYNKWDDEWYDYYYYEWYYKNYVVELDLSDLSAPSFSAEYNIPGKMVGAGDGVLFTISQWSDEGGNVTLNTLALHNGSAEIISAVNLGSGWIEVTVHGDRAYVTSRDYQYYYYYRDYDDTNDNTSVKILDLGTPGEPSLIASVELEGNLDIEVIEDDHIVMYDNNKYSIVVYSFSSLRELEFESLVILQESGDVRILDDMLYIPQGYYGAISVDL